MFLVSTQGKRDDIISLAQHREHQHPIVVCWDCEGAIISEDNLDLHYASEHPPCTICGARMRTRDALLEVGQCLQ